MKVPANPTLTAIAIAYRNPDATLIADQVLSRCPAVGQSEFKWLEHNLEQGFTVPDTRVGRRGRVNEVNFEAIERQGMTKDHGLEDKIPKEDIDTATKRNINVRGQSTEYIMSLLTLDREIRVAAMCQNTSNYLAANVTACATGDKLTAADADPIEMLGSILDNMFIRPNTMILSQKTWGILRRHSNVIKAIYPTSNGNGSVSREQVKEELELEHLHVGGAFVNNARKGQAASMQRVWGNHICLHHKNPQATNRQGITWGLTVPKGKPVAANWFDKNIGLEGGEVIRAGDSYAELVVAKAAGAVITNVI